MRVSDIWDEVVEATGTCDEKVNYRALTRAVELLANRGLFDPLIGTIDFTVDGAYLIALPRDVKAPIRLNINNNPSFARTRLYEFSPNGIGSNDGAEIGWQWHERGYACIQDERRLPSVIRYVVTNDADIGNTLRIRGVDPDGVERDEVILGGLSDSATPSVNTYAEITAVTRAATVAVAFLYGADGGVARYQPDEEEPEYRVIKLSQTAVAVRMLYRKHVFKLSAQDDIIPLHSGMAVIRAVDAVRLMMQKKYQDGAAVLEEAVAMVTQEQGARDEGETVSGSIELQSAINSNITTNDVLIVADVYDAAAEILGPVGQAKIFDRITDAVNVLSNKSQWESLLGVASLVRMDHYGENITAGRRCRRDGYFALPRYVGAVLAVNVNGEPGIPRNRWFEFHLNGTGSSRFASCGAWDDAGDSCVINNLPRDKNCAVKPTKVFAVPENALDESKAITIFGIERLADGSDAEVYRNGVAGWSCPSQADLTAPITGSPAFVRIDRIKRNATIGFVRLFGLSDGDTEKTLLGYWYPDELEPKYRVIKVPGCCATRIRIRYRKRTNRVTSLHDVLNLRSRLAVENMLRALANQSQDPQKAMLYETMAMQYLDEEQSANNPIVAGGLQFDPGTSPGFNGNIQ